MTFAPESGVPHVSDLPNDLIQQFGRPYMERFFVLGPHSRAPGLTARYHHILTSDSHHLHDHPWDFISVIITGSYVETTPTSEQEYGPGSVLIRKAEQLHRLTLPEGQTAWTFVLVGEVRRRWGFSTDDGWVHWSEYLNDHAPSQRAVSRDW